jgi:hypothetical protein
LAPVSAAEADRRAPVGAQRTAVVVPCYDEARRLPVARFDAFLRAHPELLFVFVDDGSRDGTLALLRGLEREHPDRVRVLALPENAGKAEAVRRGVLRALDEPIAYAAYWDADLATPLEALLEFRGLLEARPALALAMGGASSGARRATTSGASPRRRSRSRSACASTTRSAARSSSARRRSCARSSPSPSSRAGPSTSSCSRG